MLHSITGPVVAVIVIVASLGAESVWAEGVSTGATASAHWFNLDTTNTSYHRFAWFQETQTNPDEKQAVEQQPAIEEEASSPFLFVISYTMMTDYIFRGINFSEFATEADEDLNHQMFTSISYSMGDWGTVGFDSWWEWFAGQEQLNPQYGGENLQEVDFVVWWSKMIEPINTGLTVGWSHYLFPNISSVLNADRNEANNNDDRTHEWWFKLAHNDAWMWKWLWPDNDGGIFNPTFLYAMDVGIGSGTAQWMEFGLSHPFAITDKLTVTPSWTLGVDHNYYRYYRGEPSHGTRLANMCWGLNMTYDLTELVGIPADWGTLALSGLLYFSDALGNPQDKNQIQDEFFGGFAVTYTFGG